MKMLVFPLEKPSTFLVSYSALKKVSRLSFTENLLDPKKYQEIIELPEYKGFYSTP